MTSFDPTPNHPNNPSSTEPAALKPPASPHDWVKSVRSLTPELARDIYTEKLLGLSEKLTTTTEGSS